MEYKRIRKLDRRHSKNRCSRRTCAFKSIATVVTLLLVGKIISTLYSSDVWEKKIHHKYSITSSDCGDVVEEDVHHFYLQEQAANEIYPYALRAKNPFIISNPGLCFDDEKLDLLVLINSVPSNYRRRELIRNTWGNSSWEGYEEFGNFKILFVLAKPFYKKTQRFLHREALRKADILQGQFPVSRENLPQKGILGMRWVSEYCRKAKFVIVTYDDMFLNIPKLLNEYIPKYSCTKKMLMCHFTHDKDINTFNRFHPEKYNLVPVSKYCKSFMVIMTSDMMTSLYHVIPRINTLWSDDLYLYGILPAQVKDSNYMDLKSFSLNSSRALNCYTKYKHRCPFIATKIEMKDHVYKLWHIIKLIN